MVARYNETIRLRTTQYYIADCAQCLCNNVAFALGGNIIETRLIDLFAPQNAKDADAEEIIERITSKLRQLGEEDGRI